MVRIGVNIIIEKRKALEGGGRTFSFISVLLHIVVGLIIVIGVLAARRRVLLQPKVYRVSIATLATAPNPNTDTRTPRTLPVKTAVKTTVEKSPLSRSIPPVVKQHVKKPVKKAIVGINPNQKEKTSSSKPRPEVLPKRPVSGTGVKRVGFGSHGSVVNLDGANFEYAYYLSIVQDRIGSNWVRTYIGKGKVKVYFRIKRSGEIVGAMIEESSGDVGLDRLALRAVTASSPLPPLPEGYAGSELGIHIWFNYEE